MTISMMYMVMLLVLSLEKSVLEERLLKHGQIKKMKKKIKILFLFLLWL